LLSIAEIIQTKSLFDYLDFRAEIRICNQLRYIDIHSLEQVFIGENVSIKRAINEKKSFQWLLDIGESHKDDFHCIASLSLSWKVKEKECYIGNLWVEPDFRGNGLSTLIFNEIIEYADELGVALSLHALPFISPEEKPSNDDVSKLADYYIRFGFRRNPDTDGISYNSKMVRFPQKKRFSVN